MADTHTQQQWLTHLNNTASDLADAPDLTAIRSALTLAWHATAAISHTRSPAAEFGWMRLAEMLFEAYDDLAALGGHPLPIGYGPTPSGTGLLPDNPPIRQAVVQLLNATATALRHLAETTSRGNADAALTMSSVAAAIDGAVEDWP